MNDRTITCDVPDCGNAIIVTPASAPKYWRTLTVARNDERESVQRWLCPACSDAIIKLINEYRRPNVWSTGDLGWMAKEFKKDDGWV